LGLHNFLQKISGKYEKEELLSILEILYKGYGKAHPSFEDFDVTVPHSQNRRWLLN